MAEAGLSNKGFAARIRATAAELDVDISPTHVDVRRWLDGVRPRTDTVRCILTVLSTKLGRAVEASDVGFDSGQDQPETDPVEKGAHYPSTSEQSVNLLENLTDADLTDRQSLVTSQWVQTATPSIITGYLVGDPISHDLALPAGSGVSVADRIRSTTRNMMDLDFQFGGGHVRKMLLFYWKTEIVPALRGNYPELARREIFSAAADAAEVLGWSAYDAGRHGAAQRYFVQGLRLAREANDRLMGAQILSNLSHQANYLGHFKDAVQLARSALLVTGGNAPATITSMFLAMEARALASLGDARACAEVLHRAEQTFEHSNPSTDPEWIQYFDTFELAGEAAHCFRDLGMSEETQRFSAQAIDTTLTPPRTRAFIGMVNAAGALNGGELDQAVALATEAVTLADGLKSDRYLRYVSDFYRSLAGQHASHPMVRTFRDLLDEKHPQLVVPGEPGTLVVPNAA
jgi:hypothetical protein